MTGVDKPVLKLPSFMTCIGLVALGDRRRGSYDCVAWDIRLFRVKPYEVRLVLGLDGGAVAEGAPRPSAEGCPEG